MSSEPRSLPLLAQAIRSVGTDEFSHHLYDWLNSACRFDNFTVVAFYKNRRPEVFMTQATEKRVFAKIDSHYVNGAYLLDPFYELHTSGAEEGLYQLSDIAPDQFQRNEYFKTYYQRTTLSDELAFLARPSAELSITVCIGRDASTGQRFSSRDLATARDLSSVVTALAGKHWRDYRHDGDNPEDTAASLRQRLLAEKSISLSNRQSEIAILILQGHSSTSIGLNLGISPQTVKVIRKQLYRKCQISSQGELYYLVAPFLAPNRN